MTTPLLPILKQEQAAQFADLALACIHREYPNHPSHLLNSDADCQTPRALHPAFYGCWDWHSAVHGHWLLVRLLRLFPDLPQATAVRAALNENLTAANLLAEAAYFSQPNRQSFERPYGWAWALKLAEELYGWADADAANWSRNLQPMAAVIVGRYHAFLPRQTYPIRVGTHANTAFGLAFALDYARATANAALEALLLERSQTYFAADRDYPAAWEPSGADFFSPSLIEADLMTRVLSTELFADWFAQFLPAIADGEPKSLLYPAAVSDRSDPQIVHLDGLNLSRAWCLRRLAQALPKGETGRQLLLAADRHSVAGLAQVASGDYAGTHWLASFAVYLLTESPPKAGSLLAGDGRLPTA
jgi:hypothetical protein